MSKKVIERVALASFTLADTPVVQGQVVQLDDNQFGRAVAAGCVYKDETADQAARNSFATGVSAVAVTAAISETPQAVRISEAQASADAQISRFDQLVAEKRDEASAAIAEIDKQLADKRQQADLDLEAIAKEVQMARTDADSERAVIAKEISDAREQANEALEAIADEVEKAKKSGKDK